jgi:uncharacterized protein (DUF58 family)
MADDIFKKIRRIEIKSRQPVNQLFAGEYRSVFKGQGLEFHEVRAYQPGDDIRQIDWNVSARLGHPFIKKFVEERQRTIILLVDVSGSLDYGSLKKSKNEMAAELSAVLAFSAIKNNDLVGVLLFSDIIEKYIPPKKGRQHVLRIIREILYFKKKNIKTNIAQALRYFNRVQRKSAIVFLISDFLGDGYEPELPPLAKRHDLIPIVLKDRYEQVFPEHNGLLIVEDPESGEIVAVDGSEAAIKEAYRQTAAAEWGKVRQLFRRIQLDCVELSTDGNYIKPLNLYFKRQEKRRRR